LFGEGGSSDVDLPGLFEQFEDPDKMINLFQVVKLTHEEKLAEE